MNKESNKAQLASPMLHAVCVGAAIIFTVLSVFCFIALTYQFNLWILITAIGLGVSASEYWYLSATRQRPERTAALLDFLFFTRP